MYGSDSDDGGFVQRGGRADAATDAGSAVSGEQPVNDLVESLGWSQPQVSKHLGVLRAVGLVNVRREGRRRLYSVNGMQLKPIYDWAGSFEKFWDHHLVRIKARAEEIEKKTATSKGREQREQKE